MKSRPWNDTSGSSLKQCAQNIGRDLFTSGWMFGVPRFTYSRTRIKEKQNSNFKYQLSSSYDILNRPFSTQRKSPQCQLFLVLLAYKTFRTNRNQTLKMHVLTCTMINPIMDPCNALLKQ